MSAIHFVNEFLSRDFFAAFEICSFAYFLYCIGRFVFLPQSANLGMCAETLAPIFEEPKPVEPRPTLPAPKASPTLSSLIRKEVAKKGIRELRQEVRDRNLQSRVRAITGKTVAKCSLEELRRAIA